MRLPSEEVLPFRVGWQPFGSRRRRAREPLEWWQGNPPRPVKVSDVRTGDSVIVQIDSIAAVARAVGRSVKTVRRWEETGLFPIAFLVAGSQFAEGLRRVYPVDLISEIAAIAADTGVFEARPPNDLFVADVRSAFDRALARIRATATHW